MLDWIAGYVRRWAGRVGDDILDALHWGLHAIAGVIYTVFGNVGRAWINVYIGATDLIRGAERFGTMAYNWIRQIVTVDIPVLWHVLLSDVRGLIAYAERLYSRAIAAIEAIGRYASRIVDDAVKWVTDHVWAPLKAYADQIAADLLKWGYFSWRLLNDPPKLAAILLGALIASAESAFWSIAAPAGRFALGIVLHNASKFASLIESILTAVL